MSTEHSLHALSRLKKEIRGIRYSCSLGTALTGYWPCEENQGWQPGKTLTWALGRLWWRAWSLLVARGAAALCVAGVALGGIDVPFAWQAWHLATSTCVWRGRRGTWGTGLALVASLAAVSRPSAAALCVAGVAGVALGDIDVPCAWQAWHLATSMFHLRDRPGPWQHRRSICVPRGTWRHLPAFGVAGVALGALGWLWWRAWPPLVAQAPRHFAWQAWHLVTLTFHVRGRRGTWQHRRSFAWQAWHLATSTFHLHGKRGTTCVWHGRHGTWGTGPALVARLVAVSRPGRRGTSRGTCVAGVAGVALAQIHLRFAWQAWHLAQAASSGKPVVTKLHAGFHFGCVGFETAVTCLFVFVYSSIVCGWFLAKVQHGALQS